MFMHYLFFAFVVFHGVCFYLACFHTPIIQGWVDKIDHAFGKVNIITVGVIGSLLASSIGGFVWSWYQH
jgi:hypothetical protein